MSYLLPTAIFLLMVSVGMSLKLAELLSKLRQLDWSAWLRMVLATFLLPPLLTQFVRWSDYFHNLTA
jgi:predicted Na+-dependent transporter